MIRKTSVVFILTTLLLSACGGESTTETPNLPTAEPIIATLTATVPPEEPTATDEPPVLTSTPYPTNDPNCTNSASFVDDITIPDNTIMEPDFAFTKTWRVENTGTCIWTPEYTLAYYSGEQLGALAPVPLSLTWPGETVDISVELTSPIIEGSHQGNFVIKNAAGLIMQVDQDSRLWVIISVSQSAANSPTSTISPDAACAYTSDFTRTEDVVKAINDYRTQNGLANYSTSVKLQSVAQRHAVDMACNQIFTHDGSDGSTPQSRVADEGITASAVSENVYGSYPPLSPKDVVIWWATDLTDVSHNQNLLSTQYTQIGVGYAFFDNYGFYVIVFIAP